MRKAKLYKEYKTCERCNIRFEVKHKLRVFCDECKKINKKGYRKFKPFENLKNG